MGCLMSRSRRISRLQLLQDTNTIITNFTYLRQPELNAQFVNYFHLLPKVTALTLCLFILVFTVLGQSRQYPFEKIGVEDGLPSGEVSQIIQDREGFLWMVSMGNLSRYDGHTFKTYHPEQQLDPVPEIKGGYSLLEDKHGWIWVGSSYGLHCYRKEEDQFHFYAHRAEDPYSLPNDHVQSLYEDDRGRVWVGTGDGLAIFDEVEGRFNRISFSTSLLNYSVSAIYQGSNGLFWIAIGDDLLILEEQEDDFVVYFIWELPSKTVNIFQDDNGQVWLGTRDGLFQHKDPRIRPGRVGLPGKLDHAWITHTVTDNHGHLWIGLHEQGLIRLDLKDGSTLHFQNEPDNPLSLGNDLVKCLLIDRQDQLWIGTYSGLNKLSLSPNFPFYQLVPGVGRRENLIHRVHQDNQGGIWMASRSRQIFRSPTLGTSAEEITLPEMPSFATHVQFFFSHPNREVWMATGENPSGNFIFDSSDQNIRKIDIPDEEGRFNHFGYLYMEVDQTAPDYMWLGQHRGLIHYHLKTESFEWFYPLYDLPQLITNGIKHGIQTTDGKIWLAFEGTSLSRIGYFDIGQKKFHLLDIRPAMPNGETEINIRKMIRGDGDVVWLATAQGLGRIDSRDNRFQLIITADGLPEDQLNGLAWDQSGKLWIKSIRHITRYDPELSEFQVFRVGPEMQELNVSSSDIGSDGRIFFGGNNGLYAFYPEMVRIDSQPPPVVLTDLKIANRKVDLERSTELLEKVSMQYDDRVITFEFAALHYLDPDQNRYRYRLEGFDRSWTEAGHQRTATYTNLDPGRYTFRVQAANAHGVWNREGLSLSLTVIPPWWQSSWASLLWALLVVAALFAYFRFQRRRWELKTQLQVEQREAVRLKELDEVKTRLYTNITHELRTPLTVIKGVGEQISGNNLAKDLIRKNIDQLLQLIQQILTLSKLESGTMSLEPGREDIVPYLKYLTFSFEPLAAAKKINLTFIAQADHLEMDFDREKMRQLVSNLISNAIKFTPKHGEIAIRVAWVDEKLKVEVSDTGIGIAPEELPHIFERYRQATDRQVHKAAIREGTGIGLALVRELVQLMEGQIVVESEPDHGTTFTLFFPIRRNAPLQNAVQPMSDPKAELVGADEVEEMPAANGPLPRLLVIEDNADIQAYLRMLLTHRYQLSFANDGVIGLEKAREDIPDIIICDVMMPEKDGFAVCAELKSDRLTSHIPVVLLTAKGDQLSRETGLQRGADAYLAKPFEKKELFIRLEQLIRLREQLRKKYSLPQAEMDTDTAEPDLERQFLQQLDRIIRENLSRPDFKIEPDLCRAVMMSRPQLYRKLKALSGLSPSQYLRKARLEKARKLLHTTSRTIGDIAEEVGFNDASYFARIYAKAFREMPSEERK